MISSNKKLFLISLILLSLLSSTSSHPLSLTSHAYGILDKILDKVTGGDDDDNGGSDDDNGGSDDDNGGSDNGGSDNGGSDNGGSDNGGSDNGGSDNSGSDNSGSDDDNASDDGDSGREQKNDGSNQDKAGRISSVAEGQIVEEKNEEEVIYVSIKNANNETQFVPDDITLSTGATIVWTNNDTSDHTITVGSESKSEYSLLNSLILPDGMVDHQFHSEGTYYYSDIDFPESKGTITVLNTE